MGGNAVSARYNQELHKQCELRTSRATALPVRCPPRVLMVAARQGSNCNLLLHAQDRLHLTLGCGPW